MLSGQKRVSSYCLIESGIVRGQDLLLKDGLAEAIYSIDEFVKRYGKEVEDERERDDFFYFCQRRPTFEEAVTKFGDRVYEAELEGLIEIVNGIVEIKV